MSLLVEIARGRTVYQLRACHSPSPSPSPFVSNDILQCKIYCAGSSGYTKYILCHSRAIYSHETGYYVPELDSGML